MPFAGRVPEKWRLQIMPGSSIAKTRVRVRVTQLYPPARAVEL